MASLDPPEPPPDADLFADSRFGSQAVGRLRAAFERSSHPMLIAVDHRRWITANAAAGDLLGMAREEVPWRRMDDFTPPSERKRLEEQWARFLTAGAAEGWYELCVPHRGSVSVEFSATAHVLPSRHLSVLIPPDMDATAPMSSEPVWTPITAEAAYSIQLTDREREVIGLVASGLNSGEIAERLILSPETIKSHVQNAMVKLGASTRAHAVAIALVTGQVIWET